MQKHFSISLDVYATAQKERPFSGNHFPRTAFPRFYVSAVYDYSTSENSSFPTPQSGQRKSSGTSSHFVPASTPLSGSPISSS